jgi:hypothetical protein
LRQKKHLEEEDKFMKTSVKTVMVWVIALMVVAGMFSYANAGGAVNWKVKVTNNTDKDVEVNLHYNVGGNYGMGYRINKGGSHTFETGAKCPFNLEGWVYGPQVSAVSRCVNGLESKVCSVVCADSDWKITVHADGAYHFDKD